MTDNQGRNDDTAIDHEARSMAQRALDRQDAYEKSSEERARRAEMFETEMKRGISRIHQRMDETEKNRADQRVLEAKEQTKLQTRQSVMWAGMTFTLVFGVKYFMGS